MGFDYSPMPERNTLMPRQNGRRFPGDIRAWSPQMHPKILIYPSTGCYNWDAYISRKLVFLWANLSLFCQCRSFTGRKCRHFDEIFVIGYTGSCQMTTSGAANDENFINMVPFRFQWTLLLPCRCHCSLDGSNSAVESETKLVVRNKWILRVWSWLEPDSIIGFSVWLNLTPKNRNVSFWWAYRFAVRSNIRLFGLSWCQWQQEKITMTSSNGNIFRVTGPLWGESTGHRWIPRTKASDAEIWCFLWSAPEETVK